MQDASNEMRVLIEAIKNNAALWQDDNFLVRLQAMDALEFNVLDQARDLAQELEGINQRLFQRLRHSVRIGTNFRELIRTYGLDPTITKNDIDDEGGYDSLDVFLNGLFSADSIPSETLDLDPEMVFYQKTPGQIVLEMVERAAFNDDDVFYDLGSGLGQVPILVNLLSGVTAKGVEYEPSYCSYAGRCAKDLRLSGISFLNMDVRDTDLSDGTVFFLYTPFTGKMLEQVLEKLRAISERKTIRIFTYGPCTFEVSKVPWLRSENQEPPHAFTLRGFGSV